MHNGWEMVDWSTKIKGEGGEVMPPPRAPTALRISSCRHQITKEIFQVPNFATRAHFLSSWQFMHHSLQNPTCQKEIPKAPELSQARQVGLVWCPAIAIKITPSAPTQLENHFCKTAHPISFKLSFSLSLWPSSILAGYSSVISLINFSCKEMLSK